MKANECVDGYHSDYKMAELTCNCIFLTADWFIAEPNWIVNDSDWDNIMGIENDFLGVVEKQMWTRGQPSITGFQLNTH